MQEDRYTEEALAAFDALSHELNTFMDAVSVWFRTHPKLNRVDEPIVHSLKSRVKNRTHLREKIIRKSAPENVIDGSNIAQKVTDLTGIRVLHLHLEQLEKIHEQILDKVNVKRDWYLNENPRAYTWDPESKRFFEGLGLEVHVRESSYTSVHYVIRPREDSPLCCEIQVRTLFEEIWGEVDHALNYPVKSQNIALREQLSVLAKVVGAGSRLVDSIYRTKIAERPPEVEPTKEEALSVATVATTIDLQPIEVTAPVAYGDVMR